MSAGRLAGLVGPEHPEYPALPGHQVHAVQRRLTEPLNQPGGLNRVTCFEPRWSQCGQLPIPYIRDWASDTLRWHSTACVAASADKEDRYVQGVRVAWYLPPTQCGLAT